MFHLPPKKSFINRWGHALRIPQTQLCTLHLAIFAACLFVVSPGVQAQQTSGDLAGTLQQLPADDCGCRNMPGGYPCRGACQPCMMGVDCACGRGAEQRWSDMKPLDFGPYAQGGYAGPSRLAHLSEYRLRPGDQLQVIYLITRRQKEGAYRLTPGDQVMIDSTVHPDLQRGTLERGLTILPDGTITVRLLGEVHAAGLTIPQLRGVLEKQYWNCNFHQRNLITCKSKFLYCIFCDIRRSANSTTMISVTGRRLASACRTIHCRFY